MMMDDECQYFHFVMNTEKITIICLPELRDSRQVDKQHCATDASCPHNWRRRIPRVTHRWSTYIHHPKCSLPSDWRRLAKYSGSRSMWWKNSALSLRLDERKEGVTEKQEKRKINDQEIDKKLRDISHHLPPDSFRYRHGADDSRRATRTKRWRITNWGN